MADNKKYYYLRLKESFFEDEAIIILESMPDGYIYCNILLKLYLRSLKNDGRLMYREFIPYTPEVIAQVTRHSVGDIKAAIEVFEKLGLVEVLDNGAIYMLDIQELVGNSSTEADRKRRYRAQIEAEKVATKSLENGTNVRTDVGTKLGQMSGHTGTRDRDRDRVIVNKSDDEAPDPFKIFQENFGALSLNSTISQDISHWINDLSPEVVIEAMKEAALRNASYAYAQSIMKDWLKRGINTIEKVNEARALFERKKSLQSRSHGQQVREEVVPEFLKAPKQQNEVAPPPGGYVNPFAKNEEV